ncbi:MAG: N-glycosylase/DNA lyase [Methanomassiliicoccales archaeon]|nr:MAG: N-glycosylase/DNA lyase [Methanomassiliicoccales archaeon]
MSVPSSDGNKQTIKDLKALYLPLKTEIKSRLKEFERIWETGTEEDIFSEFAFCIMTPQSKARSCDAAVKSLLEKDLLVKGNVQQIAEKLRSKVRFHNTKAKNIVEARRIFTKKGELSVKPIIAQFPEVEEARKWLVGNIRGIGYKEASHFLRNIGFGKELAILDRHILKNLQGLKVINEIPTSLSRNKYLSIEKKMKEFAENVKIPLSHLDLLLWYKETNEIFK